MILSSQANLAIDIFRLISGLLDRIIYGLFLSSYNLFTDISKVNIFGDAALSEFSTRIYTIVGVVMLFKLSFSIITYIMEPDKLTDEKNGFGSIIKNIVIMLIMVIAVPFIFKYAMALQYLVIEDNTIGRLITGRTGGTSKNAGEDVAVATLSSFIYINEGITACHSDGDSLTPPDTSNKACEQKLNDLDSGKSLGTIYFAAIAGKNKNEYKYLIDAATKNTRTDNGEYVIEYSMFISGLVGAFISYIIIIFCFDVALRTIKLGFLQLIAPIPIVSYMDEKGKQGIFKKWVDECKKTYLSLFIKLASIHFAIYILSTFILKHDFNICTWEFKGNVLSQSTSCHTPSLFVKLFLIIGTLSFAKELPKLLESFGFGGNLNLNPAKNSAGKLAAAGIGAIGGMAAGGIAAGMAAKQSGSGTFGSLMHGIGSGITGGFRGGASGFNTGIKKGTIDEMLKKSTTGAQKIYQNYGTTWGSRKMDKWNSMVGADNAKFKELQMQQLADEMYKKHVTDNPDVAPKDDSAYALINDKKYLEGYNKIFEGTRGADDMAKAAAELDEFKDIKDARQSYAERLENDFKAGNKIIGEDGKERAITADEVQKAKIDYSKAAGDYDKKKTAFDKMKTMNSDAGKRYDAYQVAHARQKAMERKKEAIPTYQVAGSGNSGTHKVKSGQDSNKGPKGPTSGGTPSAPSGPATPPPTSSNSENLNFTPEAGQWSPAQGAQDMDYYDFIHPEEGGFTAESMGIPSSTASSWVDQEIPQPNIDRDNMSYTDQYMAGDGNTPFPNSNSNSSNETNYDFFDQFRNDN